MKSLSKIAGFLMVFTALVIQTNPSWAAFNNEDRLIGSIYAPFSKLLDKYLIEKSLEKGGLVTAFDYAKASADSTTESLLGEQNRLLADFDTGQINSRELALAFWTNAYNYFMIAHILENPLKGKLVGSVRDYGSLFNPYRIFGQKNFDVGGRRYSLDEIEKDILLGDDFEQKGWKEARIHFAVNCASVGCPPLRKQIYLPGIIDRMMTENTRKSLNTRRHLQFQNDTLLVTRLFDWYANDFVDEQGSVEAFIKKYADVEVQKKVDRANHIRFVEYDWSLNKPDNFEEFGKVE